ncbi:MAG: tetraacyldisaccharide 4'-kinase [Acidobacteriota bacterium]
MSSTATTLQPPPIPRSLWQRFYGAVHAARRRWWRDRAQQLPRPVISIGNLHFGGSGKTPLTAAVAAHLRDRGHRVAILSRGYGRQDDNVRLVSRGEGPLLGPRLAGDEPVLLAGMLPGVSVVVAAERFVAGRHAMARLDPPPDLFLLDDGFAHIRLRRQLDILAFPASDPFAGGKLLPGGRLREPLAAVKWADAVVLTGTDAVDQAGPALARALHRHGFTGPGFAARTCVEPARALNGESLEAGTSVLAVSGIARPERFLDAVRDQKLDIVEHLSFEDHEPYEADRLDTIRQAFTRSRAAWVVTTAKDRVKLQGRLELPLAEIPIVAAPEPGFWHWLDSSISELP